MKNKLMPPTYLVILLLLSIGLHLVFPIKRIIFAPYTYLGWVLIGVGVFLNIWIDWLFKKKGTTIKSYDMPAKLITTGAYRISRHPIYLGMLLILLGAAVVMGSLVTFVFPVLFVILTEGLFISAEEKNLEKAFGKKYREYKKKVRKWI